MEKSLRGGGSRGGPACNKGGGGGGGGVYYQAVTGEARTTPFRVTTAQTSLRRRERTPAAKSCPAVSSPLPLNPLAIYCHALSRRPPCRRVEDSLYEGKAFTAGSTGRGGSSARAVVVTALVTGRRTGLRPSLPNFPRSRVPQKRRLVVVEEKEDPSIPGSTGKATLRRRGSEQSSSRCLLSRGEKSM